MTPATPVQVQSQAAATLGRSLVAVAPRPIPTVPDADALDPSFLSAVALGHVRITGEQALDLYRKAPLLTLGRYADLRARGLHGDRIRTYVIDRNINYTNVCNAKCTFCAFRRDGHEHDAYTLEHAQVFEKIAELVAIGGTQILMQGGMNPALPLEWYEELLRGIKSRFPHVHVHGFSPPEFIEFVHFFDPPGATLEDKLRHVMSRLRAAGLDSLPGGGGEIFAGPVRRKIGLGKCDAEAWLTTMWVAHTLGMFTSATMMFGHIEGAADRVHHMLMVREWQDRALARSGQVAEWSSGQVLAATKGSGTLPPDHSTTRPLPLGHYKAFISWPFQRENTPLGRLKEWGQQPGELNEPFPGDVVANLMGDGSASAHKEFGRRLKMSGSTDYLRTQALSRLVLDNVYSIGASWVTMGSHIGQVALHFGATDMGSVMMEENVVSSAGTTYCLNEPVICRLIRTAGFVPAQRDNSYDLLRVHDGPNAPDLKVEDWSKHRAKRLHQQAVREDKNVDARVELTTSAAK
jgi:cyclic dehypoxanthinyl futalosine synthase